MRLTWLHSVCRTPFLSSSQHPSSLRANSSRLEQNEGPREALRPRPARPGGCAKDRDPGQCLFWGKCPQWVLSSYLLRWDCLLVEQLMIYSRRWISHIYTREHLFHSCVMRGKGEVDWTSQGNTRVLSCWLNSIFCVSIQQGQNPIILTDFNCRAKQNQTRSLHFSSYFSHLKWKSLRLETLPVKTWSYCRALFLVKEAGWESGMHGRKFLSG